MPTAKNAVDIVEIKGLKEFLSALKESDGKWPSEIQKASKEAASVVAGRWKADSGSGTLQQQFSAKTIRAGATQMYAKVMAGNMSVPFAWGAFMGSRGKWGWYGEDQYAASTGRQFPPWVGNQWDTGESWEGHTSGEPYILGGSLRSTKAEVMDRYDKAITEVMGAAFPD